jgi:hypothetical protein
LAKISVILYAALFNIQKFVFNFAIIYKVSFEPVPVTKAEQAVDKSEPVLDVALSSSATATGQVQNSALIATAVDDQTKQPPQPSIVSQPSAQNLQELALKAEAQRSSY